MAQLNSIETLSEEELIRREQEVLDSYRTADKKHPIRTLLKMCGKYRGKLLFSAIFCALQLSASLFIPIATGNVVDAVTAGGEECVRIVVTKLLIAVGLLLINIPMQKIYISSRNDAARSIAAMLRGAIVNRLQHMTIRFSKEMASGRIQSKIMIDVDSIHAFIVNLHTNGVHILVNLSTVIVVLIVKGNLPLLLFFSICGPVAALVARFFKKDIKQKSSDYRRAREETNARVNDMVNMIPVTKAHALENEEIDKLTRQVSKTERAGYRLDAVSNRFTVSNWLVMQFFQLACLALAAYMTITGKITAGDIAVYLSYFSTFVMYISQLANLIPAIASGCEAVNSIDEILGSNELEDDRGKQSIGTLCGEYIFKNVVFHYKDDDRRVLNGLDLVVKQGETVALVGESGSGKSTIVNLVTGFNYCTDGTVTVDGKDIKTVERASYRRQIAVVLQNSILFSGSVRDNITYGAKSVSEEQLREVIREACLEDVIADLPQGLDTMIGEHGNRLSGGQRQRISIARALIRDPRVIILDEATSALDTVSEKHIQQAIENLGKNKTMFIVAHRLSTVKNADKIAVIKDGRCVEFGTYDELVEKQGEFYKFRQLQI